MLIYLASMLTDHYPVLIISPLFQQCELYELLVLGFPTESTHNMILSYNVTIPRWLEVHMLDQVLEVHIIIIDSGIDC